MNPNSELAKKHLIEYWALLLLSSLSIQNVHAKDYPPSDSKQIFNSRPQVYHETSASESSPRPKKNGPPPSNVKYNFGSTINIPEIIGFFGGLTYNRFSRAVLTFGLPLPVNVRVEMPSDIVKTNQTLAVATPANDVNFKVTYGPHFGARFEFHPFENSFFIGTSLTRRKITIAGVAESPILICSLIEAVKEPPCGRDEARIETATRVRIEAKSQLDTALFGLYSGAKWELGDGIYSSLFAGIIKPKSIHRQVEIDASLISKTSEFETQEMGSALRSLEESKENEMRLKAIDAIAKVDEKTLPYIGLDLGWQF